MNKLVFLILPILFLAFGCTNNIQSNLPGVQSVQVNLPKSDVSGFDLSQVPRYNPSVRTSFENDSGDIYLDYYTSDSIEKVRQFYLSEMEKLGWTLKSETANPGFSFMGYSINGGYTLEFEKGTEYVEISIGEMPTSTKGKVTVISITYYPPYEETQNENSEEGNYYQQAYDETQEITPYGKNSDLDSIVRPAIQSVFGNTKLISQVSIGDTYTNVYIVPKEVDSSEFNQLIGEIASEGWNVISQGTEYSSYGAMLTKDTNTLVISVDPSEPNKISFMLGSS